MSEPIVTMSGGAVASIGAATDPAAVGDGSLIGITKQNRTLLTAIAASVAVLGSLVFIGTRLSTDTVAAKATAAAPTYIEGTDVKLSTDLSGVLRTTVGGGGGNPTAGRLDSIRRLDSLRYLAAGRLDSVMRIDTLRYLRAGRLDSLRRLDTLRYLAAGRLDSLRRLDTLRYLAAGRLDSVRRIDTLRAIAANMTHIGRVTVDSQLSIGNFAPLAVTATAAVNVAATATLPAVAGQFHYIVALEVKKRYSVIGVAAGAGIICTTTNLPGNPAWDTEQLASPAGTVATVIKMEPAEPLRSSVVNTATTIVCPQQLQTIWRINVWYYAAP